ncbi:MAG: Abi family protein [Acholeplasmataceae bacterium]
MSSKEFLTFDKQIEKLNNEKKIVVVGKQSREYIVRNGYFNLINGYKEYFCRNNGGSRLYYDNIKIDQFKMVMSFDRNIRKIIFKYVTQIEEEIGSIYGYFFESKLTNENINWGDMSLYSFKDEKSGREILSRIYSDISKRNNEYLMHYENKHSYLPSWIMIKGLTFGNLIKLISHTDDQLKIQLCDLYQISYDKSKKTYRKIISILSLLNALRNKIAHSERIIDFKGHEDNKNVVTKYHKSFGYTKPHRETLFDALLYMKMLIPGKEYKHLINEIRNEFDTLKKNIHNNAFLKVCQNIGLDTSINHQEIINLLKSEPHIINYENLIV